MNISPSKPDVEAQHLKNEIEYLSKLINTHKAQERPKLHITKNKWTLQSSNSINKRDLFKWNTATSIQNDQPINNPPQTAIKNTNPYRIVKPNINATTNVTEKPSTSQISHTVLNNAAIISQSPKTPNLLKTKYKLVKARSQHAKLSISSNAKTSTPPKPFSQKFKRQNFNKFKLNNKYSKSPKMMKWNAKQQKTTTRTFSPNNSNSRYSYFNAQTRRKYYAGMNYVRTTPTMFTPRINKKKKQNTQLVSIGGLFYRATQTKLSRTITPKKRFIMKKTRGTPKIISVRGMKYKMDRSGKTLTRMSMSAVTMKTPLSRIDLGGSTYKKTNAGLYVKSPITEARAFASRAIHRSIIHQANFLKKKMSKTNIHCIFYVRFGKCHKGDACKYIHDAEKIAVCTRFLRGTCKTDSCPFSHIISPDKMPVCSYFLQGRCSSDNCPYRHVNVNSKAEVCKEFVKGVCSTGKKCKKLHIFDCPSYLKTGACMDGKNCILRHVKQKPKKLITKRKSAPKILPSDETTPKKPRLDSGGEFPSFIAVGINEISSPDEKLKIRGSMGINFPIPLFS